MKTNKSFLIPLFLGIAITITGFILLMTDPFSTSNFFLGPVLIFVGFICSGFVTIVVFATTNSKRKIIETNTNEEQETTLIDELSKLKNKFKKLTQKECPYCQSIIEQNQNYCPNCGAKSID